MEIKNFIFDEMRRHDWTPAELARRSGVPPGKFSNLKDGRGITAYNFYKILKAFRILPLSKEMLNHPVVIEEHPIYLKLLRKYVLALEENKRLREILNKEKDISQLGGVEGLIGK